MSVSLTSGQRRASEGGAFVGFKFQKTRNRILCTAVIYCGALCTAVDAIGVEAPQFESFHTVPFVCLIYYFEFCLFQKTTVID